MTVLLVDDHPIVLKGLRELLDGSSWRIVGEATTGEGCLVEAARTQPEIVVLDLRLPDGLAPEVCRELRRVAPGAKTVVLTGFDDEALLDACLAEGAAGILLKDASELDLVPLLERVRRGEMVLDPRLDILSRDANGPRGAAGITQREHDVLRLVARGMTSADIAAELHLSVNTVRTYVQSILEKTGTHTRIEALAEARRMRLI
ncbi:MAG: response regulator [Streptosporangiales bacterium]|nr:response regulator [Streptosporangiales bacterium]